MRPADLCTIACLLASLDAMCEPGKHISDTDFFNELNTAIPCLEPVRAAADGGHINIPGSREAANAPYIALRKEGEPPVTFCVAISVHPNAKSMAGLSVEPLDAGGWSYRIGLGERRCDVVFETHGATFELH